MQLEPVLLSDITCPLSKEIEYDFLIITAQQSKQKPQLMSYLSVCLSRYSYSLQLCNKEIGNNLSSKWIHKLTGVGAVMGGGGYTQGRSRKVNFLVCYYMMIIINFVFPANLFSEPSAHSLNCQPTLYLETHPQLVQNKIASSHRLTLVLPLLS